LPGFAGDLLRTLLSPYNLLFLFGIAVAWIVQRGPLRHARLLAAVGIAGFLAVGMVENARVFAGLSEHGIPLVLLYGVTSMLIITGLATAERAGDLRPGRVAGLLGALSYPLYLTHGMAISAVVALAGRVGYAGPGWLLLVCAVAIACAGAMVVHHAIELPVARWLKRLQDGRRKAHALQPQ
jgi:exopolysaccharide production protein ExoZ